ncbi:MAG: glycosyltransferase family 4 protein [Actinobacteria bacterium]|nr:glycosyltransferase family 4 protein [Actinomycetota bacterium]
MRVFHVSDCYAPRVGGVESQIRDLAHAQAEAGNEVHVLTVEPGVDHERGGHTSDEDGLTIHRMGARLPFRAPFNPRAIRHVDRLVEELRPDVLHVHAGTLSPFAYQGARVGIARGIPVATTWHSMLDHAYPVLRPWAKMTGWEDTPIAWSAVSRVAGNQVARVFAAQVEVLHNGIHLEAWAPSGDEVAPTTPPLRCISTMRLVPSKRTRALIEIIARVVDELPPGSVTLEIFGAGPEEALVRRRIRLHGLEDVVTLHGRTPRHRLREAYRAAHVFCVPATREAFGLAVLEARTAGLVVVGRSGTGIEEFITNEQDGLLAASDREMAADLLRLATDPRRLGDLRAATTASVPPFGVETVMSAAFAEYDRARSLVRGGALSPL